MNEQPTQFGLYAGQGGFELAYTSEGFQCVGIAETDPDANIVTAEWFGVENFGDVLKPDFCERILESCPPIDVLTGGVPCQPASLLGKRLGQSDERWLWDRTIEITGRLRPAFAQFENPSAILTVDGGSAFNGIVRGLAEIGFDCWWELVPASIFGAGHLRERIFIICVDTNRDGGGRTARPGLREGETRGQRGRRPDDLSLPPASANSADAGLQGHARMHAEPDSEKQGGGLQRGHIATPDLRGRVNSDTWWHETNTGIPVLAHGISSKLVEAACRLTGNAVVPQVVQPFARAIYQTLTQ